MAKEKPFGSDRHLNLAPGVTIVAAALAATPAWAAVTEPSFALPEITAPADSSGVPTFKLITDGKTGCAQGIGESEDGQLPAQCAFDSSAFGTRVDSHIESDAVTLDSYAAVVGTVGGMWTADQLLGTRTQRFGTHGSLVVFGFKGSLFDELLTIATESDWSQDRYLGFETSNGPAQTTEGQGHANSIKIDFNLLQSSEVTWSFSSKYSSVSDGYSTGRSVALLPYFALPGTRLDLSSKIRVGRVGLNGSLSRYRTSFGETDSKRVSVNAKGVTLTFMDRASSTTPDQQIGLARSETQTKGLYADFDVASIKDELFPQAGKLATLLPISLSVYLQSGQSEIDAAAIAQAYRRSSVETTASWQTPLGDTDIDYMSQHRTGLIGLPDRDDRYLQLSHSVHWHNWRFGADAMLSSGSSLGTRGSVDKSLSFGGSIAYYVSGGPEFRFQVGQDQTASRLNDDSFTSMERYSTITGSLDLSRYLQRRFERKDLHLTLDYRRALSHDDSSLSLFGDAIERLIDGYDRSGFLLSFAMKL